MSWDFLFYFILLFDIMNKLQFIATITEAITSILLACFDLFKPTEKDTKDAATSTEEIDIANNNDNYIVGGYYPNWIQPAPKLSEISNTYNLLYIFHAVPDEKGGVQFNIPYNNFFQDVQLTRTQGRKVLLTVGGANAGFNLNTRQQSTLFLESVKRLITYIGGVDGIDFNNFEGHITPNGDEMVYIARNLKTTYGQKFMITCPPAPWRDSDLYMCKQLLDNNLLDYAAPQWYDGPGLTLESNILFQLNRWVSMLGENNVVVGLGVAPGQNYMNIEQAKSIITKILTLYPNIRGVFQWQAIHDSSNAYQFANVIGNLINK